MEEKLLEEIEKAKNKGVDGALYGVTGQMILLIGKDINDAEKKLKAHSEKKVLYAHPVSLPMLGHGDTISAMGMIVSWMGTYYLYKGTKGLWSTFKKIKRMTRD